VLQAAWQSKSNAHLQPKEIKRICRTDYFVFSRLSTARSSPNSRTRDNTGSDSKLIRAPSATHQDCRLLAELVPAYRAQCKELGRPVCALPWSLIGSWVCFLLAIGFGLSYQWLATRRPWDQLHSDHITPENAKQWDSEQHQNGANIRLHQSFILIWSNGGFFYLGAILFVVFAATAIQE